MDRRKFISSAGTVIGAIAANADRAVAMEKLAPVENADRPNVLIIMSDQHKRSCMGVAGDTVAITPNLDKLARESVRFTQAYCTNPVCAPSRASILTGLDTHHLETTDNATPYSPKDKTIADQFAEAGSLPRLVGKMHFVDAQTHGFQYKLEFHD